MAGPEITRERALELMEKAHDAGLMDEAREMMNLAKSLEKRGTSARSPIRANGFLGQVNQDIGAVVDFINPFDNEAWEGIAGGALKTPSAGEIMQKGNIASATRPPEGAWESAGSGVGSAGAALIPVAKALQAAAKLGGATGAAAREAYKAMLTRMGVTTEIGLGGISSAAGEAAVDAGAPEWARPIVEMAAPVAALPLLAGAGKAAGVGGKGVAAAAEATPMAGYLIRAARDVKKAVVPMTDGGAREVAREELIRRAGSEDRARELSERIQIGDNPLELTPAQQIGDQNFLALEKSAAVEDPTLRARLEDRAAESRALAKDGIHALGGDVKDARSFFKTRVRDFRDGMKDRVDRAIMMGDESIDATGPRSAESDNSELMVERVKAGLSDALEEEKAIWAEVPQDREVPTGTLHGRLEALGLDTPEAQQGDIPQIAQLVTDEGHAIGGETATVKEMLGLYSELRRIGRSAMAGNDQRKNQARIADELADSILTDLGAIDADTPAGAAISNARAFSRTLHETFDQGAVGRILNRTIDGDETMTTESALKRTVGPGGVDALAADRKIREAAPHASANVEDYLRMRFVDEARDADGTFKPTKAGAWLRKNREILSRNYPDLNRELSKAMQNRTSGAALAVRADARVKMGDKSAPAKFIQGQEDKAILSILKADDPTKAARSIKNAAAKDPSGAALDGIKGAFTDYLIDQALDVDGVLTGKAMRSVLRGAHYRGALRQVFKPKEIARLDRMGAEISRLEAVQNARADGPVIDSKANAIISFVLTGMAASRGGEMGGGSLGGSIKWAEQASGRAQQMLYNLTNTKARQLLHDAIEDPELMKTLMADPTTRLSRKQMSLLAPYLTGAAAASLDGE